MQRSLCLAAIVLTPCLLAAAEHVVKREQLPAAVLATFDQETKGAQVKQYLMERENGATVYEAETMLDGHSRDVQVAKDGTLQEIEEEVQVTSLPISVQKALFARAHGGDIAKVESLTKKGSLVAYEAVISRNGHKHEVQVGPRGEKLAHEE